LANEKTQMKNPFAVLMALVFTGCVGIPENVTPVSNFKIDRYLGKWYEIARFDHSFEQGLIRTTAEYSLKDDGGVRVLNRGYRPDKKEWKEAEGKAYFVDSTDVGYLKVSFFGPFYGSYIVCELDHEKYEYSLVCGPDKSYLWILARTPQLAEETKQRLVAKAAALGFDTSKLIYVEQK
jgi:apolipoprotein D and lipocalin family protein